ncbi:MAG: hypothetical protein C4K49_01890 [Candidatus Thorarchaeota archaeon]|nr:MAG: hypothetical protein C4K49_01890 [Candidatus Thorarchaeota archaeon]
MKKVVVPCSGIGKAFGAVSRETTHLLTQGMHSTDYRTVCLPLLMTDDTEARQVIEESEVYVVDGCPMKCASVVVKHAGGKPVMEIIVPKVLAVNKDHRPATVLDIGEGGRLLCEDIVRIIIERGGKDE